MNAGLTAEGRRILDLDRTLEKTMTFQDRVTAELASAREKFPKFNSAHEGFAVLYEEVDELWDEVKKKQKDRNRIQMLRELIQVAAMAQRMAEDIVLPSIEASGVNSDFLKLVDD